MKNPIIKQIIFTTAQIEAAVQNLQNKLNTYYADAVKPIVCIGILRGCFPFFSDLLKGTNFPNEVYFIDVSSYEGAETPQTNAEILQNRIDIPLNGRDILIIDDIFERGLTLQVVRNYILQQRPASLKSVILLTKEEFDSKLQLVDWYGLKAVNQFLVGYGLDYQNQFRYLPYIAVANPDYIKIMAEAVRKKE